MDPRRRRPSARRRGRRKGRFFHVINAAKARSLSSDTLGWKRMPPLNGPPALLCGTRQPVKFWMDPSSHPNPSPEPLLRAAPRRARIEVFVEVKSVRGGREEAPDFGCAAFGRGGYPVGSTPLSNSITILRS
jgi:hypothetical protein